MKSKLCLLLLLGVSALAPSSFAVSYLFTVTADGAQEVAGGDPDGSGIGTVLIDAVTKRISWDFTLMDVALPLTGAHIHNAAAGFNGPVVVNFSGAVAGSTISLQADSILASPTDYYVNFHNSDHPGGAVRGQLGEPTQVPDSLGAAWGALGLGIVIIARRRGYRSPR